MSSRHASRKPVSRILGGLRNEEHQALRMINCLVGWLVGLSCTKKFVNPHFVTPRLTERDVARTSQPRTRIFYHDEVGASVNLPP